MNKKAEEKLAEIDTIFNGYPLRNALIYNPPPKLDNLCEWCGLECCAKEDFYFQHLRYQEDDRDFNVGWVSPECGYMAECALECCERDNS